MNVIIEHIFCQYSDEATALYLKIINVILLLPMKQNFV